MIQTTSSLRRCKKVSWSHRLHLMCNVVDNELQNNPFSMHRTEQVSNFNVSISTESMIDIMNLQNIYLVSYYKHRRRYVLKLLMDAAVELKFNLKGRQIFLYWLAQFGRGFIPQTLFAWLCWYPYSFTFFFRWTRCSLHPTQTKSVRTDRAAGQIGQWNSRNTPGATPIWSVLNKKKTPSVWQEVESWMFSFDLVTLFSWYLLGPLALSSRNLWQKIEMLFISLWSAIKCRIKESKCSEIKFSPFRSVTFLYITGNNNDLIWK